MEATQARESLMNHDTYKKLKRKNKKQLEEWLSWYGYYNYDAGLKDSDAATCRRLVDNFNFTDEMIAKFRELKGEDIDAINERYITAKEIIDGLIDEGYESLKGDN